VLERTGHPTSTTVRVMMRNEREREKRKQTSMGTRSARGGGGGGTSSGRTPLADLRHEVGTRGGHFQRTTLREGRGGTARPSK